MENKIKYYVDVRLYFKVSDSYMFGGEGSVGYMSAGFEECTGFTDEKATTACEALIAEYSKMLDVAPSKIQCISKEEYDEGCGYED